MKVNYSNNLNHEISILKKLGEDAMIDSPDKVIEIARLSTTVIKMIKTESAQVYISRKSLKHIMNRRGDMAEYIIFSIPSILNNPSKISDNSNKRQNSFLFAKMNGNAKGVVLEITKTTRDNRVVSAFSIDRKTYRKMIDISGRTAVPPFATPKSSEKSS